MAEPVDVISAPSDDWRRLFCREAFHRLNAAAAERVVATEITDDKGRLLGGLSGAVIDGEFINGFSAPFGGVDIVHPNETAANILRVVHESLRQLAAAGIRSVTIKLPPASYSANEGMIQFGLLNCGFSVVRTELNQAVDLGSWSTAADYERALRPYERNTLRHLMADEFQFGEATDPDRLRHAYDLLALNRQSKGRRMSLSYDYVVAAREGLAPHIRVFDLRYQGQCAAAALVYRVAPATDLIVMWGHLANAPSHQKRSPMLLLAYELVANCMAEGVTVLDIGISNEPEAGPSGGLVPNYGLTHFKRSVLARVEPRFTLRLELT